MFGYEDLMSILENVTIGSIKL